MIAVVVPIPVLKAFGGFSAYNQVAVGVVIKPADDV